MFLYCGQNIAMNVYFNIISAFFMTLYSLNNAIYFVLLHSYSSVFDLTHHGLKQPEQPGVCQGLVFSFGVSCERV